MNLLNNLQALIEALKGNLKTGPYEKDGTLHLVLREEVLGDPAQFLAVFKAVKMDDHWAISRFIELYSMSVPIAETTCVRKPMESGFKVDLVSLKAEIVRDFFNPDTDQKTIGECLAYLSKHGWSSERLKQELNMPKMGILSRNQ